MSTYARGGWICASCARQQFLAQSRQIATSTRRPQLGFSSIDVTKKQATSRQAFHNRAAALQEPPPRPPQESQALPLGDFYTDLLATPIPQQSHSTTSLPTFVQSGDLSKEERARKLFGTMERYRSSVSESPDATWRTINGVPVPPRPAEPDNCCMSGCAHCVWDDYRDDVESWALRLAEAKAKSPQGATTGDASKVELPRPELHQASGSMDDDGGGSEALWTAPAPEAGGDELFQAIPVGIREFMATEKRIRERKKAKKEKPG